MNIQFPDIYKIDTDTFDVSFPAEVDGNQIKCVVTTEALQDINPSNVMDNVKTQFSTNKVQIQEIAKRKIRAKEFQNGKIIITSTDVR